MKRRQGVGKGKEKSGRAVTMPTQDANTVNDNTSLYKAQMTVIWAGYLSSVA